MSSIEPGRRAGPTWLSGVKQIGPVARVQSPSEASIWKELPDLGAFNVGGIQTSESYLMLGFRDSQFEALDLNSWDRLQALQPEFPECAATGSSEPLSMGFLGHNLLQETGCLGTPLSAGLNPHI